MMLSIMDPHSAHGIAVRILHEWTDLTYIKLMRNVMIISIL